MIWESIMDAYKVKDILQFTLPRWSFEAINENGKLGGLLVGWFNPLHLRKVYFPHNFICIELFYRDLNTILNVINLYGPYMDHKGFWDSLFAT